jgi:hypothetical protein
MDEFRQRCTVAKQCLTIIYRSEFGMNRLSRLYTGYQFSGIGFAMNLATGQLKERSVEM